MSEPIDTKSDAGSQIEDENWEDWVEEDERIAAKSLFSDKTFANVEEALQFDTKQHGFDLNKWRAEVR